MSDARGWVGKIDELSFNISQWSLVDCIEFMTILGLTIHKRDYYLVEGIIMHIYTYI